MYDEPVGSIGGERKKYTESVNVQGCTVCGIAIEEGHKASKPTHVLVQPESVEEVALRNVPEPLDIELRSDIL